MGTYKSSVRLSRLVHSEAGLAKELIGADWHRPTVAESGTTTAVEVSNCSARFSFALLFFSQNWTEFSH